MADKILLCISATQAILAQARGRTLAHCEIFQADEEGLAAFGACLAALPRALVYLAADAVEEDYRHETLPHATGADRDGMLDRKLKQYYRNTPYVTAIARGRAEDKRRDDRYLFAALTNPALIEPWLAVIARCGLPVAGIHLISMQTGALARQIGHPASRVLVVAPHHAGLRLTFYKDSEFCISRLSRGDTGVAGAANEANAANTATRYATEIANTRAYLSSLRLDSADDPLTVLFLDPDDSRAAVVDRLAADNAGLQCVRAGQDILLRRLRLAPDHLALAMETAYLALMAEKAPDTNLAPATVTAEHRLFQRRNAIHAASATLGLAALAWSGYNTWLAHDYTAQTAQAARLTLATQARYRDITREFPAAPTTSENLINAVEIYKKISSNIRSPEPFMQIVSRAIEQNPEIFLQELHWAYGTTVATAITGAQPAAPADSAAPLKQSGYFTGEIRPFQGDYRAAIAVIDTITKRLTADAAVARARVVKYPLNVNSGLALSGNTRDAADQAGIADFKIEVTLKPGV